MQLSLDHSLAALETRHRCRMEFKDKIAQRRKERSEETNDAFKKEVADYARTRKETALKDLAARELMLREALDVISGKTSGESANQGETLSLQSAHKVVDDELKSTQSNLIGFAAFSGLALALYVGFVHSWGAAVAVAFLVLAAGEIIGRLIAKEKKKELIEQHLRSNKTDDDPQA